MLAIVDLSATAAFVRAPVHKFVRARYAAAP
jgi:hypothetical protein